MNTHEHALVPELSKYVGQATLEAAIFTLHSYVGRALERKPASRKARTRIPSPGILCALAVFVFNACAPTNQPVDLTTQVVTVYSTYAVQTRTTKPYDLAS